MTDAHSLSLQRLQYLETAAEMRAALPHLYGWKFYPWARKFFDSTNKMNLLCAANQISKAVVYHTLIPTSTGLVAVEDLKVGDYVFGRDGRLAPIIDIPFDGEDECFELEFDDGSTVTASRHHEWVAKTSRERFRKTYTDRRDRSSTKGETFANESYDQWGLFTTEELIQSGRYSPEAPRAWNRCAIPLAEPVDFPPSGLFDPYFVGLIIGDGCTVDTLTITTADQEIVDYITKQYGAKHYSRYSYGICGMADTLRGLGLKGKRAWEKFIPPQYFTASAQERLALLRGLMDTDGCSSEESATSYSTASKQLADDVVRLVCSLGGKAKIKERSSYYVKDGKRHPCRTAYNVSFKILVCPFRLKRKTLRFYATRYRHERVIYKITPVGRKKCRCITVGNSDGTFLCTDRYIVTHNSSTMIRKCIHWATAPDLWPKLWARKPLTFVYGFPTKDVATLEYHKKWKPEFLPKESLKEHPIYGWRPEFSNGKIHAIHFNSGVSIYLKTYAMDVQDLQTVTSWAHFIDEELPEELYSELQFRLAATDGYWHGVFTPTLGQEFWRQAIEEKGQYERFKGAFKQQVSMYDCLYYDDGTRSPWTEEQIKRAEMSCKSEAERLRRVFGRFVIDEGLKYPAFVRGEHFKRHHPVPPGWIAYIGCDPGSGGDNHPAAICIVAVSPCFTMGRVIRGWRGDGVVTTVSDVVSRAKVMRDELKMTIGAVKYDWASRDFYTIAQDMGLDVQPAEKSHAIGEQVINVLFRNNMLYVYDLPELEPLAVELSTLKLSTPKTRAKDDFADAFRYAVTAIPWDWSAINGKKEAEKKREPTERDLRREMFFGSEQELVGVEQEIASFNELVDPGYDDDYSPHF